MQLGGQFLVLIVKRSDPVRQDQVIPGTLPALIVNFVAKPVARLLTGLDVHDLGLIEHIEVEAEDFFVLAKLWRLLLARRSHRGRMCFEMFLASF